MAAETRLHRLNNYNRSNSAASQVQPTISLLAVLQHIALCLACIVYGFQVVTAHY
jgi:hypothetical protein